ncbi:glycosyltransferase family 2 protein [Spiribacter sp. C176]|uniref:Glycosyltransferase family 2 protein n=1 Tax=Spiribacter salilacus TaxID=2664894 RepID=A0A6N7QRA6_9GAMM|nr:glycosyltransferase family A protein [Spiribacter salilacus]MRH79075.1 glycosyltransferase family 2 protein [Spiribacter salilacus]
MTSTFTPLAPLQTAVLFLVFNRPDTTTRVFEAIRQAKPPRLYVAADGPREGREGEAERVAKVREIATAVDWPCEVKTLFREENLGCKYAVSGAITWFFEQEEQGIILEDDCLPHPDFFSFCETLLARYADDERVSVITGNNFQHGQRRGEASYYFSKYNHCWGWASWRRAWRHYQGDLPFWPAWSASDTWQRHTPDTVERRYWEKIFDRVRAGQIDSWGYPWTASVWFHGGLTATPNVNLVSNIGFGPDSTHTASANSPLAGMATSAIGELTHPASITRDQAADRYVFDHTFDGKNQRFPWSLLRLPRRTGGFVYRKLKRSFA